MQISLDATALLPAVSPARCERSAGARYAAMSDMLVEEMTVAHRVAISNMENVAGWSENLRTVPDLTPAAIVRHAELIQCLGQTASRIMTTIQRSMLTFDRLETSLSRQSVSDAGAEPRASARTSQKLAS